MTKIANPVPISKKPSIGQQISKMMTLLQKLQRTNATDSLFREVCGWTAELPESKRPEALISAICHTFGKTAEQVDSVLKAVDRRPDFDLLLPESGWLRDYVEWTRQTEPPTVFHFFVAATVIGAALGRNVYYDKGAYQVFPNLRVMIIAPTGRCRKTSACNLGTSLLVKVGGNLLADKTTPEAFVDGLKTAANATGLIYAPELAVFLGKQKYNEGMVPLLTALFDCPKEWTSKTIGRGDTTLTNVALSALMCSTIDWIQTGIPKDAFGGGFMSRFLFVVQESTPRVFALPPPLDTEVRKSLTSRLTKIKGRKGAFALTPGAKDWYESWYQARPTLQGDKQYAGYFERKPDHLICLAMVLRMSEHVEEKELTLSEHALVQAERILNWLEAFLPSTFSEMTESSTGEDQSRILRHLRLSGGTMEHSALLRKNSSRLNAEQFKRAIATLKEAKMLEWDASTRCYTLTAEGWG